MCVPDFLLFLHHMTQHLIDLEQRIKSGHRLSRDEAVALAAATPTDDLCMLAGRLREHFHGNFVDTCSIINARSGRCPEDCKWCSQSRHHKTNIDIYPLIGSDEAVAMARNNAHKGVRRFSLVTSGRGMTDSDIDKACRIFRDVAHGVDISLCASMGLLSASQLRRLRDAGVSRYHCNLETAPSYFPHLCSTHTTGDKIETLRHARDAGMEICSGGIIGMGETPEQRIELAVALRELGVASIPVNVLNPIPGTPLEKMPPLSDDEILRSMAMFRIVVPDAHIRFAGGRNAIKHLERRLLHVGVSASIVGDMLTTSGSDIETDKRMFREEGFAF